MKNLAVCTAMATLAFGAAAAAATPGDMSGMKTMDHAAAAQSGTLGEHSMPGTVTKVDHKTGIVYVTSMGMHLVVHFPPPTIKDLKARDKIVLHIGYSYGG